jgi:hypothetical protein
MSHLYCFRLQGRSLKYVIEYADVEDEEELTEAIKTLPEHSYVHLDFEAVPGAPAYYVCEPLHVNAVEAIQKGNKPKFIDTQRKETFDGQQTSRAQA